MSDLQPYTVNIHAMSTSGGLVCVGRRRLTADTSPQVAAKRMMNDACERPGRYLVIVVHDDKSTNAYIYDVQASYTVERVL